MWGSAELWAWLNQLGILCTIIGFVITLFTLWYVRKVRILLIKKNRIPETSARLSELLPVFRDGLRDWDARKEEVFHISYQFKGYLKNIHPSLGDKEKALVKEIFGFMKFRTKILQKRRDMTREEGWHLSRLMTQFETMLAELDKDNEATRL